MLLICISLANAALVREYDFENYSIGNLKDQEMWDQFDDTQYIDIVAGQWVRERDPGTTKTTRGLMSMSGNTNYEFEFDLYFNGSDVSGSDPLIYFTEDEGGDDGMTLWCAATGDNLYVKDDGETKHSLGASTCLKNKWVNVMFEMDDSNDWFSVWYNGSKVLTNISYLFKTEGYGYTNRWSFSGSNNLNAMQAWIDNWCVADDVSADCFGGAPTDTCASFATTGYLNCNDNCTVSANVTVSNNVTVNNTGTITFNTGFWYLFGAGADWVRLRHSDNCVFKMANDSGVRFVH